MDPTIPTGCGPRRLPLLIKLGLLFGGPLVGFGWMLFAFGMIFVWVFHADDYSFLHFRGKLETTDGTVTAVDSTRYTEGGRRSRGTPVYKYHYRFTTGGKTYESVSYKTGGGAKVNTTVPVEFVPGHPEISRIASMRTAPFGPSVLFVLIFPLIGLGLSLPYLFVGFRNVKLLQNGKITHGKLTTKEPTNTQINKQTVFKLTFLFKDAEGQFRYAVAKTHLPEKLQDERLEMLFYNPRNPSQAVLRDSLPGELQITEMGRIQSPQSRKLIASLTPPLIAFLVVVIGIVIRFR